MKENLDFYANKKSKILSLHFFQKDIKNVNKNP